MASRAKGARSRVGRRSAAPAVPPGANPAGSTILMHAGRGVATLTLNRSDNRNAISPAMIEELERALRACARGSEGVVIVTGAGSAFSGGMDLQAQRRAAGQSPSRHLADSRRLARLLRALYDLPRPTIAAVNGPAIAGGCGLATVCDFVLAAPEATFGYPEVRIGFIPAVVSVFLVRQVGERRTRELLLSGRTLGAEEALRIGLITEVVPGGRLMQRARELADSLLERSPASLRETKKLLNGTPADLGRALEAAARAGARMRRAPDFREGLTAFLEKRKPVWPSR